MPTTPTPQTDAFLAQFSGSSAQLSDFARQLERECAALRAALTAIDEIVRLIAARALVEPQ